MLNPQSKLISKAVNRTSLAASSVPKTAHPANHITYFKMAPTPKTFACDDSVLAPAIKSHISSLYLAMDERECDAWGAHFTDDAVFTKEADVINGRDSECQVPSS